MEMSGRAARRHVEIFNFSFLDILACVIGLLIFILTIVVISGGIGTSTAAKEQSAALARSEESLQQAKISAELAARRRQNAESLLRSTASDASDVTLARDVVERQIQQFDAETADLVRLTAAASLKLNALRQQESAIDPDPTASIRLAARLAEITSLNGDTDALQQKIRDLEATAPVARKEVSFYVPRVRSSSKYALFLEISGKKMWTVDSEDYRKIPQSPGNIYIRRANAQGVAPSDIVADKVAIPTAITSRSADSVVLTFVVRPDGYESFREIREWAWKKGYSVHWIPLSERDTIHLVPVEHSWEQ